MSRTELNPTLSAGRYSAEGGSARETSRQRGQKRQRQDVNVGDQERAVSVASGALMAVLGLSRGGLAGLMAAGAGAALVYRGLSGHCPAYTAAGVNTADHSGARRQRRATRPKHRLHVSQTFLVDRSPDECYRFWRDLENLPRVMTHLQSVTVLDDRRSHWVASAPRIAGGKIEWDAEITHDEPGELIAWRSLAGTSVDNAGSVRFTKALGERGTSVQVTMDYDPPAGRLGEWVAKLFGEGAEQQIRSDLRNFKRIMEVGEAPTIEGQPRGTCKGYGKREGQ